MSGVRKHSSLEESRIQGTFSFPCTMYQALSSLPDADPVFFVKPHWHNAFELLHFEEGSYDLHINTDSYEVREEAFCFVESEKLHSVRCSRPYTEHALVFDPEILASSSMDESTRSLIDPLIQKRLTFPAVITRENPCFAELKREFRNLLRIFNTHGERNGDQLFLHPPGPQLRVKAGILTILAAVFEEGLLHDALQTEDPRVTSLKQLMIYIQTHYTEKIYLHDLAAIMHMNEQYFCRFFNRITNRTPVAYINDIRIRKAALLLSDPLSEITVLDAAEKCGFTNSGHFISEFRKRTGMAPNAYRLSKRQNHPEEST